MSKSSIKNCGNCGWAKFQLTDKGNIRTSKCGKCTAPIPTIPSLPDSMLMEPIRRFAIWPKGGIGCPAHKISKKKTP